MSQQRFADVSSHNAILNWGTFLGSLDGVIVKVSEGIGYAWSGAPNALAQARSAGKLVGVYHFARVNDPIAEADYFLANYKHQPGEVIVLDWEPGMNVGDGDAWAYAWCSRVIAATGVVPWLYLNHYYASVQSQWTRTRSLGCGLWAAWYGINNGQPQPGMPSFAPWPSMAAWQYTSAGSAPGHAGALDLNYFYGTPDQWRAYGTAGGSTIVLDTATANQISGIVVNALTTPLIDWTGTPNSNTSVTDQLKLNAEGLTMILQAVQAVQKAQDPQALITAIVEAVKALPAPAAQEVIAGVLAGLNGAQLSVTQPAPPA